MNETAIENLPVNGRNFIDFVLTTPGVVKDVRLGDISFAGQRGTLNSLVIDGANNDNTFFGQALGRTGSGRAPYQFSQDAVQEFQVNTNAYSAEYGRAGGAVINVVTKSGTQRSDTARSSTSCATRTTTRTTTSTSSTTARRAPITSISTAPRRADRSCATGTSSSSTTTRSATPSRTSSSSAVRPRGYPTDAGTVAGLAKLNALAESYARNQDQDVYLIKTDHELGTANHLTFRYNRQEFVGKNFESGGITSALEHTGNSNVTTDTYSASFASTVVERVLQRGALSVREGSGAGPGQHVQRPKRSSGRAA